jgi:AhpD family alkylhydroperoxidase
VFFVKQHNQEGTMKGLIASLALSVLPMVAFSPSASAQDAPQFMKDVMPPASLAPAWQEYMAIGDPNGALDAKTKELIGLGVAAQIPCGYCVYYHTQAAKHLGATDAQIKEAVAAASMTRKWSTELNGNQYDMSAFKKQVDAAFGAPSQ